ncbi:hypothetical protein ACPCG0_02345 [Propionibacteriaceae bacterium Y1923]|uniref:hypothetical protein n=1 Tax=Aestuariimicrobium sp. Y1814 TaxID=3418742 RepID=UPI003C272B16
MAASRRSFLTAWGVGGAAAMLLAACSAEPADQDPPVPVTIAVTYKNGTLLPNAEQVNVVKGATVTVTVDSDQDLRVHLHGYEEVVDAEAGVPTEFSFVADLVGSFELETHEPTRLLAQLIVRDQ